MLQLPSEAPLVLDHRPPRGWPARGEISFRNYSTRYREGLSLVLRNINCDIHSCEKVSGDAPLKAFVVRILALQSTPDVHPQHVDELF